MNILFRCVRITHEEKKTLRLMGEPLIEETVTTYFELAEKREKGPQLSDGTTFGYVNLVLPASAFKTMGYEVGKVYALIPT